MDSLEKRQRARIPGIRGRNDNIRARISGYDVLCRVEREITDIATSDAAIATINSANGRLNVFATHIAKS